RTSHIDRNIPTTRRFNLFSRGVPSLQCSNPRAPHFGRDLNLIRNIFTDAAHTSQMRAGSWPRNLLRDTYISATDQPVRLMRRESEPQHIGPVLLSIGRIRTNCIYSFPLPPGSAIQRASPLTGPHAATPTAELSGTSRSAAARLRPLVRRGN